MQHTNLTDGPIICIGGANVDRKFYAKNTIMEETSNPVTSSITVGGVARNIAENLGRLGQQVSLISVKGNDADWLEIANASHAYMDLSPVVQIEGAATGAYTAILDPNGDLAVAFADMDIFDALTPLLLKEKEALLARAQCILVDLNCSKETVNYLSEFTKKHDIPFMIVPVSSPKMDRLPETLDAVDWLIVNKDETETFLHHPIQTEQDWRQAVEKWLALGSQNVIVTNGSKGVMAGSQQSEIQHFESIHTPTVTDVTGAGDSFCAAVIYTWLQKESFNNIIQAGLVNAHKTILSKHTVRKELSAEQLQKDMEELN